MDRSPEALVKALTTLPLLGSRSGIQQEFPTLNLWLQGLCLDCREPTAHTPSLLPHPIP